MDAHIFDIDGTLLDSADVDDRLYRKAVVEVLGDVELRPSLHDYHPVTDSGILAQILVDNGLDADVEADVRRTFVELFESHFASEGAFPEVPGAREYLRRLQRDPSVAVAFATGGWRMSAELKLTSSGFGIAGIPLLSADDAMQRPRIMQLALQRLGDSVQSVRYYGDGEWDRRACAELGWEFVAVGAAVGGIRSYDELSSSSRS